MRLWGFSAGAPLTIPADSTGCVNIPGTTDASPTVESGNSARSPLISFFTYLLLKH
jgi:hypothetical protein